METIKEEKKAEGKLVKGGYASFNEYGELVEEGKMEKKSGLEQLLSKLLNDLLRMGWKPFNRDKTLHIDCYNKCKGLNYKWIHLDGGFMNEESRTLRELVSIDSGLWQFVCENDYWVHKDTYFVEKYTDHTAIHLYQCNDYRYWLLGSALCDEDKLEDFILSNIKVDE